MKKEVKEDKERFKMDKLSYWQQINKISAIQGDWKYLQCSRRCHDKLYDSVELFHQMNAAIDVDLKIPTDICKSISWKESNNIRVGYWSEKPADKGTFYESC
jgi:hypothetical protein